METCMEIPQRIQNGFTIWTQEFQFWLFKAKKKKKKKKKTKQMKTPTQKGICTPKFTVAVFTSHKMETTQVSTDG